MNKWSILLVLGIAGFISIYALNAYLDQLKQSEELKKADEAATQRKILNESLTAYFKENFQRQNFLGNETVSNVISIINEVDKLLKDRTPRFDRIEGNLSEVINLFHMSMENQRTIIHNQYEFSKQMNVSNVSNHTR